MYCKNCGQPIDEKAFLCMKCGYRNGDGDKFCANCGKNVSPGQSLCLNCGFMLNDDIEESKSKAKKKSSQKGNKSYLAYTDKVKKINILTLVLEILLVVVLISTTFIPIYKYEYTPEAPDSISLKELEKWAETEGITDEEWELILKDEPIERNFSMSSDVMKGLASFDGEDNMSNIAILYVEIFPLITVIFAIVFAIQSILRIISLRKKLLDPNNAAMLKYDDIKKGAANAKVLGKLKSAQVTHQLTIIALYIVMDVIFGYIFSSTLRGASLKGAPDLGMLTFAGVSTWIIIPILAIVGFIVVNILRKNEENAMTLEITSQEYN